MPGFHEPSAVTLEQAKLFLADSYDPDELVELLQLDSIDILDAFEERVIQWAKGNIPGSQIELDVDPSDSDNDMELYYDGKDHTYRKDD